MDETRQELLHDFKISTTDAKILLNMLIETTPTMVFYDRCNEARLEYHRKRHDLLERLMRLLENPL